MRGKAWAEGLRSGSPIRSIGRCLPLLAEPRQDACGTKVSISCLVWESRSFVLSRLEALRRCSVLGLFSALRTL